jgi:hypothetical protein
MDEGDLVRCQPRREGRESYRSGEVGKKQSAAPDAAMRLIGPRERVWLHGYQCMKGEERGEEVQMRLLRVSTINSSHAQCPPSLLHLHHHTRHHTHHPPRLTARAGAGVHGWETGMHLARADRAAKAHEYGPPGSEMRVMRAGSRPSGQCPTVRRFTQAGWGWVADWSEGCRDAGGFVLGGG